MKWWNSCDSLNGECQSNIKWKEEKIIVDARSQLDDYICKNTLNVSGAQCTKCFSKKKTYKKNWKLRREHRRENWANEWVKKHMVIEWKITQFTIIQNDERKNEELNADRLREGDIHRERG